MDHARVGLEIRVVLPVVSGHYLKETVSEDGEVGGTDMGGRPGDGKNHGYKGLRREKVGTRSVRGRVSEEE